MIAKPSWALDFPGRSLKIQITGGVVLDYWNQNSAQGRRIDFAGEFSQIFTASLVREIWWSKGHAEVKED